MFTDLNPSNVWTCHKGFRREVVQKLTRTAAPMPRARRSLGRTGCEASAASCVTAREPNRPAKTIGVQIKKKAAQRLRQRAPLRLYRNHHQHPAISSSGAVDVSGHGNRHKGSSGSLPSRLRMASKLNVVNLQMLHAAAELAAPTVPL